MKTAIIYARVSTKRQADDGLPIESQIQHCQAKATAMGAKVLKVFVDGGISGSSADNRPDFQDAMNYCAVVDVDYFICWASSRFARNAMDAAKCKAVLARCHTRLVYSSSEVDISTDDGWLLDSFTSIIDERYSRQVAADTRRSMLKAAGDGCFLGGRTPFGYAVVPDGKRKRLVVQESEGATIRAIFAMALEGCGAKLIAMQLNAQGVQLRGKPWAKNTVSYILNNEVYAGFTVFNRTKARMPNPQEDWVRVKSHEALVTAADFEKVQNAMHSRQPTRVGGQPRSHFAFTGLLRCTCGASMQTSSGTGRSQVYYYYGCRDGLIGKSRCGAKKVRADLFDEWLLAQLLDQVLTVDRVGGIITQAQELYGQRAGLRKERRAALVAEMRAAEAARGKLFGIMELHGRDTPNLSDLTQRLRELNDLIKRQTEALMELENAMVVSNPVPSVDPVKAVSALRKVVLECDDPRKLREFIGSFVKVITVGADEVTVDYHPECLVQADHRATIRSEEKWLPALHSLRTARLVFFRPERFSVERNRACVLTLAA